MEAQQKSVVECSLTSVLRDIRPASTSPKLLLLWATDCFAPFDELLSGIGESMQAVSLADVPLIGASVGACMFDQRVQEQGAVLICLESDRLEFNVQLVQGLSAEPATIAENVLGKIEVDPRTYGDFESSFALTYLPGGNCEEYCAGRVIYEIAKKTDSKAEDVWRRRGRLQDLETDTCSLTKRFPTTRSLLL